MPAKLSLNEAPFVYWDNVAFKNLYFLARPTFLAPYLGVLHVAGELVPGVRVDQGDRPGVSRADLQINGTVKQLQIAVDWPRHVFAQTKTINGFWLYLGKKVWVR